MSLMPRVVVRRMVKNETDDMKRRREQIKTLRNINDSTKKKTLAFEDERNPEDELNVE